MARRSKAREVSAGGARGPTYGDDETVSLNYANLLIYRLQKALHDERGTGAKFRTSVVGKEELAQHYRLELSAGAVDDNVSACKETLKRLGIVEQIECSIENNVAEIEVDGCVHFPVEQKLMNEGISPFTCMCTHLINYGIEKSGNLQTEVTKIDCRDHHCKITVLLFDAEPTFVDDDLGLPDSGA